MPIILFSPAAHLGGSGTLEAGGLHEWITSVVSGTQGGGVVGVGGSSTAASLVEEVGTGVAASYEGISAAIVSA